MTVSYSETLPSPGTQPWDVTLQRLLNLVQRFDVREGNAPDTDLYRELANLCIDDINNYGVGIETYWSNDISDNLHGRLVLSGNTVTFPSDCLDIHPRAVLWNGIPLSEATRRDFDEWSPGWAGSLSNATQPGFYWRWSNGIYLDAVVADTTGLLVAWGVGCIPHFDTTQALNPLAFLGQQDQMSLLDGIIGRLPAKSEGKTAEQLQFISIRQDRAMSRWEKRCAHIASNLRRRVAYPEGVLT